MTDPANFQQTLYVDGTAQGQAGFPLPLSGQSQGCTTVWSIAGFDPSSGAGVTADLMTFAAHNLFGCSAITALTVQSTLGVFETQPVAPALLAATLNRLAEDLSPGGIKIGMLGDAAVAEVVADFLKRYKQQHGGPVVVLDPVLRSSSGRDLFPESALPSLHADLLPRVDWITPNWAELTRLTGLAVADLSSAEYAGRQLLMRHPHLHLVVTGGDCETPTDLLLLPDGFCSHFAGEHVSTTSTHGTGCAFSSALLANLVAGAPAAHAVRNAKEFVAGALRAAPGLGHGRGPMGLLWQLHKQPR